MKRYKRVYDFLLISGTGERVSWESYKGKVLLIVNTATNCGFTNQLGELEALRNHFDDEDFEILAFPSNDFLGQEPRSNLEIFTFCKQKYQVGFPIFQKSQVTGKGAHPLFKYLSDKRENGMVNISPKWNFHKYLISKEGMVVDHFYTFTNPTSQRIKKKIHKLLGNEN